ncbi:MAG TPA: nucleotidyltransferase domain-containing protein [Thermoflexia bacterium]|nr:nucleotidyltransferase domain-containing protein [Thermoflexia bacterium]
MSAISPEKIQAYRHNFQARLNRQHDAREERREHALRAVYREVPAILARWPSIQRAYLFGSVLSPGAFRQASDIDIAVEGVTASEYFAIWRALETALPDWVIDCRDITADTDSHFATSVRGTGKLIYEHAN